MSEVQKSFVFSRIYKGQTWLWTVIPRNSFLFDRILKEKHWLWTVIAPVQELACLRFNPQSITFLLDSHTSSSELFCFTRKRAAIPAPQNRLIFDNIHKEKNRSWTVVLRILFVVTRILKEKRWFWTVIPHAPIGSLAIEVWKTSTDSGQPS